MPLLPAEPCLYPENLFTESTAPEEGVWWVLHTRPRAEKTVARALLAGRVPFFLPVYEHSRRVRGRLQTSHLPLFSSYLFLKTDDEGRIRALETNQIANCIQVLDQATLQEELAAVHRTMTSGAAIGPIAQLVPGTAVTIAKGPLTGLTGKVLRQGNRVTLVVEVRLLNQGVAVEIENWMVEVVPGGGVSESRA
jgi:transcription antitermination factor NusG